LARSAVFRTASLDERRRAHQALADEIDGALEPDRRAWHRAHAAAGPDEDIALDLERSSDRAQARGGRAAAAAFLEHAALLTPEPVHRSERGIAAAQAKREAGALDDALGLLVVVEAGPYSAARSAEVERLRGQIAFDQRAGEAAPTLLAAARQFQSIDPEKARETYLEALGAAMWARGVDGPDGVLETAEGARTSLQVTGTERPVDLVLDGIVTRLTRGYEPAAPILARGLQAVRAMLDTDSVGRWLWLASNRACGMIALEVWDFDARSDLAVRQVQLARETGALVQLQFALHFLANTHLLAGRLSDAAMLIDEERAIAASIGNSPVGYTALALMALRGDGDEATRVIATALKEATESDQGRLATFALYASAVLDNGRGRHDSARAAAQSLFDADLLGYGPLVATELAEAASRTGDLAALASVREWLAERCRVTSSDWLQGIRARVDALLGDGDPDADFRESLERLGRTPLGVELARTHLLYGEWLRRRGRRIDAREQLRVAYDMLSSMGIRAFADRARRELLATGETVRKRSVDARDEITAQEAQIARLAGEGRTNPEIGAQLFISPRTVEWHLRKVYTKLGINSRRELAVAMTNA
jgi:DNA-binding CsgD family transcriptional regulator